MARFSKGVKKDISEQARSFVQSHTLLGTPRHGDKSGKIHSIRTSQERSRALVRAVNQIKEQYGIGNLREITESMALSYLKNRVDEVGQKSLDNERLALQMLNQPGFAMHKIRIERVKNNSSSSHVRYVGGRAYTDKQVSLIAQAQNKHNELATLISHAAGLRQHELYTLRPAVERSPSKDRLWSKERFTGREGVSYTVIGKGGLIREVLIPHALAQRLEESRMDTPRIIIDQGISYQNMYHIGAGRAWAASFRSAAERTIGSHKGPHGLRHSYAQERMKELREQGFLYRRALGIVSQELGHFRPEITEVYLR